MKVIYSQETLDLLAKYDKLIDLIEKECQQTYPEPPAFLREVLGEQRYAEKYHEMAYKRRQRMLDDPYYQACVNAKAKIMSISPCSYQLDADEVQKLSGS